MASTGSRAWQRMLSGRRLDILDPSPLDVELSDIAHGLARVARWNGQTLGDYPFSVAQHSVLVEAIYQALDPEGGATERLYCLLHDAPEYVMGDIISPFKAAMGGNYKEVEARLLAAVHLRFSLSTIPSPLVSRKIKQADKLAAYFEATHLASFAPDEARRWFGEPGIDSARIAAFEALISPWPTAQAHERYHSAVTEVIASR